MKKVLLLLIVLFVFCLVSCNFEENINNDIPENNEPIVQTSTVTFDCKISFNYDKVNKE